MPVEEDQMFSGLHEECFCHWFKTSNAQEFQDVVAQPTQEQDRWKLINTSFFHGKFRKYSAKIGKQSYILKVEQEEVPELPAAEFLCNQIAQLLGLEVPDFYLICFENTLNTFVSKNFVENFFAKDLVHIYRYLDCPSHYDCEHLLQVIEKEVGNYNSVVRFIELTIFDAFIGNHDRHGRNIALIKSAEKTTLAPFYDNPCYLAMEIPPLLGAYHEPRGAIKTAESDDPLMSDYVKEWKRLGFENVISLFAERIQLKAVEDLINSSFLIEKRKKAIWKLCQRRYAELCNAI